jgi:hypothetical protein
MADNALTKKLGPLPRWGWAAVGGGILLAYLLYRKYAAGSTTTGTTTATSGGTTIPTVDVVNSTPNATTGTTSTTTPAATGYTNFTEWEQAVIEHLNTLGLSPATSVNAVQSWIRGGCVTQQGYNGLSSAVGAVGLPPGFGTSLPTLSVCASAPTTPATPATPAAPTTPNVSATPYRPIETAIGAGWIPKDITQIIKGRTGGSYQYVTTPAELSQIPKTQIYVQPTAGNFVLASSVPSTNTGKTPVFRKVG